MALAKFPDGSDYPLDESSARHMAVGDYLEVPIGDNDPQPAGAHLTVARGGIITRRIWRQDGLVVVCTDPAAPHIDRDRT